MHNKDYFGKDASALRSKKLFLLDMDGTIYNEDTLFDGTLALLSWIEDSGGNYVFITNNSSRSVKDYIQKVNRMGIPAGEEQFFTSTQAAAMLLKQKFGNQTVYCQGTRSMLAELRRYGLCVTESVTDKAAAILVGFDTELTSEKLRKTSEMLHQPIPFYATNPDLGCPVSFGLIPDCGSMCMMYENVTGRKPQYIGKPETTMVEIVMEKFGVKREETLIIGDRLYTDIATGIHAQVDTVCVLSGESTVEDILESETKPTYTFENVKMLYKYLKN